jgi:hypothetical protein
VRRNDWLECFSIQPALKPHPACIETASRPFSPTLELAPALGVLDERVEDTAIPDFTPMFVAHLEAGKA